MSQETGQYDIVSNESALVSLATVAVAKGNSASNPSNLP